jgi:hypothetical protein
MDKYEAVRDQITRARIERSVYLADLLSDAIVASWNGLKLAAARAFGYASATRPLSRPNVFTFDA